MYRANLNSLIFTSHIVTQKI